MILSQKEQRLKIWRALSDLFLDTEIDDTTYKYIARTINESGLSVNEVEKVLWYEVYPVLENNFRRVDGVWDGWPDAWLLQHLSICEKPIAIHGDPSSIKEIKRCWSRVIEFLSNENA